jgi:hypothetical protein
VAGLALTAERMAGRRHRIASVIVERLPAPASEVEGETATVESTDREGVS